MSTAVKACLAGVGAIIFYGLSTLLYMQHVTVPYAFTEDAVRMVAVVTAHQVQAGELTLPISQAQIDTVASDLSEASSINIKRSSSGVPIDYLGNRFHVSIRQDENELRVLATSPGLLPIAYDDFEYEVVVDPR